MKKYGIKKIKFDFHLHVKPGSKDAGQTIMEAFDAAKKAGINTIAITNHNSVEGLEDAIKLGKENKIKVIPGVEFSTIVTGLTPSLNDCAIHVLGLGIDPNKDLFKKVTKKAFDNLRQWESEIKRCIEKEFKIKLDSSEYRPMRKELVTKGFFETTDDAKIWMMKKHKGVCKYMPININEVVDLVHQLGGIAVFAHPNRGELKRVYSVKEIKLLTDTLVKTGLDGIELYHKDVIADKSAFKAIKKIAEDYNLLVSLGSDRHEPHAEGEEHYFEGHDYLSSNTADYSQIKRIIIEKIKEANKAHAALIKETKVEEQKPKKEKAPKIKEAKKDNKVEVKKVAPIKEAKPTKKSKKTALISEEKIEEKMHELERVIHYTFQDIELLKKAMGSIKEPRKNYSNEPLATVGDAILKSVITDKLFSDGVNKKGKITTARIKLENNVTLSNVVNKEGIINFAYSNKNFYQEQQESGAELVKSGKHDVYIEAIIAAIYYDTGYESVKTWILKWLYPRLEESCTK